MCVDGTRCSIECNNHDRIREGRGHDFLQIASQTPSPLNVKLTSDLMGITKNQLVKIFSLLERSQILGLLYFKSERNPKSMK